MLLVNHPLLRGSESPFLIGTQY